MPMKKDKLKPMKKGILGRTVKKRMGGAAAIAKDMASSRKKKKGY